MPRSRWYALQTNLKGRRLVRRNPVGVEAIAWTGGQTVSNGNAAVWECSGALESAKDRFDPYHGMMRKCMQTVSALGGASPRSTS